MGVTSTHSFFCVVPSEKTIARETITDNTLLKIAQLYLFNVFNSLLICDSAQMRLGVQKTQVNLGVQTTRSGAFSQPTNAAKKRSRITKLKVEKN